MSSNTYKYILLAFALIFLSSCVSKKKLVQKSEFSTEIAKVERVSELTQNDVQTDLSINSSSQKLKEKEKENFSAEIDDSTKKASITKKEKDGETKWEFENIKHFNAGKEKSKEETKDSIDSSLSINDKSKASKNSESKTDIDAYGSEKNLDIKKEGKFPWIWIILFLVIYLAISLIRRNLNPLGWFRK